MLYNPNQPDPSQAKQRMVARQFGREIGNLRRDANRQNRSGQRGRRGQNLTKDEFFRYTEWSRQGMKPIDQLQKVQFSHKDMVEILWEMYRHNWGGNAATD